MESWFKRLVAVVILCLTVVFLLILTFIHELSLIAFTKRSARARTVDPQPSTYREWHTLQEELDQARNVDEWASSPEHPAYKHKDLHGFRRELYHSQRIDDYHHIISRLRAQLDRNIFKILSPDLYRKSLIQTKRAIHDYIDDIISCIWYVARWGGTPASKWSSKSLVLSEVKDSVFGKTSLVLTGGAMISACHIGVVKTLYQQHLLPRIITGVATGSLVAAMVGVSTDPELRELLTLEHINLGAFAMYQSRQREGSWLPRTWKTLQRRHYRYKVQGHVFEIEGVQKFAKDNLGDLTFEEAYQKTGRILNIVIAISDTLGTPQLLNYITAPHVFIWSAVVASVSTSHLMYASTRLYCKSTSGAVAEYQAPDSTRYKRARWAIDNPQPPLQRLAELFNVNHFVVSQTRPYVFPFIWAQSATADIPILGRLVRLGFNEGLHWLTRFVWLGMLPPIIHRILIDELLPSSAEFYAKLYITPEVSIRDLYSMFELPTRESLRKWSRTGEEATWPIMCQLDIRCSVEFELERAYESVNQRRDSLIVE